MSDTRTVESSGETSVPGAASTAPALTPLRRSDVMPDSTPVPAERKAISRRLRFEILRRDNHTCRYCGESAPDVTLTVDHVVPVALGGTDDPSNLAAACRDCNAGKGSTSPDEQVVAQVDADAERWADAMIRAAEIERAARQPHDDVVGMFLVDWEQQCHWAVLPIDAERTIATFVKNGLSADDIHYAVTQTAYAGKHFRYFCGVCWRMIRDRQAIARQMLEADRG